MNFMNAINKYRRSRWCYLHRLKPIAYLYRGLIYLVHNSYIPFTCEIGEGTICAYKGMGVIIHANSKIGKNCVIGSNVTIGGGGGRSNRKLPEFESLRRNVPVIGNRVIISTGAKIIGDVVVGDDVIIGANAVVINDVPSKTIVGGGTGKDTAKVQHR